MTDLSKSLTRRLNATVRDDGKSRRLVITLYPGGVIGLRPEKTRREELLPVAAAYSMAVKMRVAQETAVRQKVKGAGRKR